MLKRICLAVAAICVLSIVAPAASAQGPGWGSPGWWGYYYSRHLRIHSNARVLPYFSLYPPVYYSHSVPRPYGFSPFALPPGAQPAEALATPKMEAKEIVNPFYKPKKEPEKHVAAGTTAKLIINPFVKQPGLPEQRQFVHLVIPNLTK